MAVPQHAVATPAVATAPAVAIPVAAVATVAPRVAAAPVVAVNSGRLAQFERVLGSAGVDVAHLFAKFGVNEGQGGPFIPVRGVAPNEAMSADKIAALGRLVKALPVSAPLTSYEIGSPFGVRGDPINGHAAYHTGLDFRAPYESPIYATAPGVVTFSGFRNDYGRIVEIDHGNGISTRYAHMHRAIVSVGQRITAHEQIGFLGSSGRATGPHVHYEVLVNGEPQDPQKFMSLGRLVQVSR
jgi:murein DD-endopeptidase MepM/ murein hydrolase activator NlpD